MKKQRTVLIVGGLVLVGAASLLAYLRRQRKDPSACPYGLRFSLDLPHPFVTRPRLREMLCPEPGQRVLEVGPGTGYYALQVARWLEQGGTLDILDIQQEMLAHTMHRARAMGVLNIVPRLGDAQALPYPDDHFDSAYLVATLGEVPDKGRALRELGRVLKHGGRRSLARSPQGAFRGASQADRRRWAGPRANAQGCPRVLRCLPSYVEDPLDNAAYELRRTPF
jgi:SAM-dependent methyltransferase